MEMGSFSGQDIINSLDDIADDGFLDIKTFVSDDQTFFAASPSNNHIFSSQAEANYQMHTSQNQKKEAACASSQLISFGSPIDSQSLLLEDAVCNMDTYITSRDALQAQNHVVAERRRRHTLTQLFIALSKILPGLKKLDKASLLGDAINYMKELQERVRILEEEINATSNSSDPTETTFANGEGQSSSGSTKSPIQEIKIKMSRPTMLIKIYCDKTDGLVQRLLEEMGKLHVTVSDFRVIPFGTNTLDITILAEMGSEFSSTVEEVVKHVEMAIPNPVTAY